MIRQPAVTSKNDPAMWCERRESGVERIGTATSTITTPIVPSVGMILEQAGSLGSGSTTSAQTAAQICVTIDPISNADRIREMSDEELAKLLCCNGWRMVEQKECLEWLQQPAE